MMPLPTGYAGKKYYAAAWEDISLLYTYAYRTKIVRYLRHALLSHYSFSQHSRLIYIGKLHDGTKSNMAPEKRRRRLVSFRLLVRSLNFAFRLFHQMNDHVPAQS